MKENSIEELRQKLEELYKTQQARLDVGADDLDIREEIAEVEEQIKELQDETSDEADIKEDIEIFEKIIKSYKEADKCGLSNNDFKNEIKALEHILSDYKRVLKENEELRAKWNKDTHILQNELDLTNADKINNYIPVQKVKDIIDRIDYDIKKTKEIISKNTNIYASYRKNDYQIVRLRAMNTKSLDIKKRLQELLESEEEK